MWNVERAKALTLWIASIVAALWSESGHTKTLVLDDLKGCIAWEAAKGMGYDTSEAFAATGGKQPRLRVREDEPVMIVWGDNRVYDGEIDGVSEAALRLRMDTGAYDFPREAIDLSKLLRLGDDVQVIRNRQRISGKLLDFDSESMTLLDSGRRTVKIPFDEGTDLSSIRRDSRVKVYQVWPSSNGRAERFNASSPRFSAFRGRAMELEFYRMVSSARRLERGDPRFFKYAEGLEKAVKRFDRELIDEAPEALGAFKGWHREHLKRLHKDAAYKESGLGKIGEYRYETELSSTRPTYEKYTRRIIEDFGLGEFAEGRLSIDGIPTTLQPRNGPKAGEHWYPLGGDYLYHYTDQAAEALFRIKTLIAEKGPHQEIEKLIGRYYHLMVNARPFGNVNNSLIMGQVNYLLRMAGADGMTHGDLDHLFMRLTSAQAAKLWPRILRGEVPELTELPR